jgi:chloramphenicol 3-O phosphotransferase
MQIIYLNGPSSVGKTTLAKALQEALNEPFLHMSFDKAIGWMPQKMNDWTQGSCSTTGFSWKQTQDANGLLMHELQMGHFANKMQHTFRDVILNLAQRGHHLIIDDFTVSQDHLDIWKAMLKDFSVLWVKLKAPLEVLEKREKERKERIVGSSRAQYLQTQYLQSMSLDRYELEFDTHSEPVSRIAATGTM